MAKLHVAEGISAESVCSMIAALCDDDYRIVIDYGDTLANDEGEIYAVYSVKVVDTDDSVVATERVQKGSGWRFGDGNMFYVD